MKQDWVLSSGGVDSWALTATATACMVDGSPDHNA